MNFCHEADGYAEAPRFPRLGPYLCSQRRLRSRPEVVRCEHPELQKRGVHAKRGFVVALSCCPVRQAFQITLQRDVIECRKREWNDRSDRDDRQVEPSTSNAGYDSSRSAPISIGFSCKRLFDYSLNVAVYTSRRKRISACGR